MNADEDGSVRIEMSGEELLHYLVKEVEIIDGARIVELKA
jgi:hypothetical protein